MNKKIFGIGIVVLFVLGGGILLFQKPSSSQASQSATMGAIQKQFTLVEIAQHNTKDSCYTAVQGKVYDLTPAINTHPGGPDKIASICGIDGTQAFVDKHRGQPRPEAGLAKLQIGVLAQ